MPELKPCPFCGTKPRTQKRQDESLWSHYMVWWSEVGCTTCDYHMEFCEDEDLTAAIEAWNRRTPCPTS